MYEMILKQIKNACLLIFILFLCACASGHHKPLTQSLTPVRNITSIEQRLKKAVSVSKHLSMREIGRVTYDGFQAPIWLVSFKCNTNTRQPILLNGGIHGNEPAGAEYIARFVETLSENAELYPDQPFQMIPIVNPWGWTHDIRFNKDGFDINRDFASLRSQESKIIQNHVQKNQYALMIDLHEDPSGTGFYLYQYGRKDKTLSKTITSEIQQLGYPLEQNVEMVILKTKNGIIDAPMWGLQYMRLTRQMSIANYYRLYNCEHVFTIETPTGLDLEDRVIMQEKAVTLLIRHFVEQNR